MYYVHITSAWYLIMRSWLWTFSDNNGWSFASISTYNGVFQPDSTEQNTSSVTVPCVRIKLLQTLWVPPLQSTAVHVQLESNLSPAQLFVIEPYDCGQTDGLYVDNSLLQATSTDKAQLIITNTTPLTQKLSKGCWIGQTDEISVIAQDNESNSAHQGVDSTLADVMSVSTVDSTS